MQEDFAALHRITEAPVAGPSSTSSSKQAQASETTVASASSKLEPFLVLARSARGPGAAAIVVDQVTAAQGVFCFGELLEVPAIAEVSEVCLSSSCTTTSLTRTICIITTAGTIRTVQRQMATATDLRLWRPEGLSRCVACYSRP